MNVFFDDGSAQPGTFADSYSGHENRIPDDSAFANMNIPGRDGPGKTTAGIPVRRCIAWILFPEVGMSCGLRGTKLIRIRIKRRVRTNQIHTGLVIALHCPDVAPVPRAVPHLVSKIVSIRTSRMNQRWDDIAAEVVSQARPTVVLERFHQNRLPENIHTHADQGDRGAQRQRARIRGLLFKSGNSEVRIYFDNTKLRRFSRANVPRLRSSGPHRYPCADAAGRDSPCGRRDRRREREHSPRHRLAAAGCFEIQHPQFRDTSFPWREAIDAEAFARTVRHSIMRSSLCERIGAFPRDRTASATNAREI